MESTNQKNRCHIGRIISDYLTKNNISVDKAAEKMCISREELNKILREPSTDMEVVLKISVKLRHNFMADYSELVEREIEGC